MASALGPCVGDLGPLLGPILPVLGLMFAVVPLLGPMLAILGPSLAVLGHLGPTTRVKTEKIRKGMILGGVRGYLEGIFGDPSLTKNLGKA